MDENVNTDRIIVGVDGSESSIDALRYAARVATAFGSPLEAITTWTYPPYAEPYLAVDWSPEEDATAILEEAVQTAFGGNPPAGLVRTVLGGPAAGTLIDQSERASMLVVGSRGHGGFVGLLLGSVSAACAEHAHCPVLIVHSGEKAPAAS